MSSLFTPYKLGPVTLRNRTIRSAAFESMGRHFGPTQQLKDYHVSVARGGVGMTTLAYAAVCRSGLSFDKQLWLRPEIVPGLREITDAVHREGAAAGIQIGHCGNMTHLTTAGQIPIGASTGFNLYAYTPVRGMRAGEIEQVARDFGRAVHTAHDAGFDSVEVHAGHGYLISQFLSPYTNRRRDEYGGSLENRMRFMRMCLEEVMEAAAQTGTAVLVKHNMYDGFKGGIEIPESLEIAREIERFGVDGIVLDLGVSSYQLDTEDRGFSYRFDAPLDMRMDRRQTLTARDIVNNYSEMELYHIIRDYGEDPFAKNIAKHIVKNRADKPIETTFELNEIIKAAVPAKMRQNGHPSKQTFQAIRIECNQELEVLKKALDELIDLLHPGGRFCIITFHSLEDRIVKNAFRRNENPCTCPPEFPVCVCGKVSKGKVITRKPILPSVEELEVNSRSKSAKLRVFEKK